MANKCERCGRDLPDQVNAEQAIYLCDDCADPAAPAAPTDQAPEYTFRLPEVTITVRTRGRARALALVGQRGEVLGRGEDYTEPSAVGLAVLAARSAIEQCGRR